MEAGRLRHSISIQKQTDETDEYNQRLDLWNEVCRTRASIEPLQGREFYVAMQVNAEVTTRIRLRWRPGIDRTMKVVAGDVEYEILYTIDPNTQKRELHLMCKEQQ